MSRIGDPGVFATVCEEGLAGPWPLSPVSKMGNKYMSRSAVKGKYPTSMPLLLPASPHAQAFPLNDSHPEAAGLCHLRCSALAERDQLGLAMRALLGVGGAGPPRPCEHPLLETSGLAESAGSGHWAQWVFIFYKSSGMSFKSLHDINYSLLCSSLWLHKGQGSCS